MEHYKSWAGLKKQLQGCLCDSLKERVSYFLTRYHDVHNAYGRAAVCVDGTEFVVFSWPAMYRQDQDRHQFWEETGVWEEDDQKWKKKWDRDCNYFEMDFLDAALKFRHLSIQAALESDNFIMKSFAILDRRVGKRTLQRIADCGEYKEYPEWVRQFYELRLSSDGIG